MEIATLHGSYSIEVQKCSATIKEISKTTKGAYFNSRIETKIVLENGDQFHLGGCDFLAEKGDIARTLYFMNNRKYIIKIINSRTSSSCHGYSLRKYLLEVGKIKIIKWARPLKISCIGSLVIFVFARIFLLAISSMAAFSFNIFIVLIPPIIFVILAGYLVLFRNFFMLIFKRNQIVDENNIDQLEMLINEAAQKL
jgi:hypothetical protein